MSSAVSQDAGDRLVQFTLGAPNLRLDLTSDPWQLDPEKDTPLLVGADVVHVGRQAPDGGRKPIGSALAAADRPAVAAFGADMIGLATRRHSDVYQTADYTGTTTSLKKLFTPYAWPADMVGAFLVRNEDERRALAEITVITSISTTTQTDDTLNFSPALSAWAANDKFYILYQVASDRRGIWLSNGRKFWLLQGGAFTLWLDLGDDDYLGTAWRGCRISRTRWLFLSPTTPPRVIDLADTAPVASDYRSMAGCFAPGFPLPRNEALATPAPDRGVYGYFRGSTDTSKAMTPGLGCRVLIRAVNLDKGLESEFVQVRNVVNLSYVPQVPSHRAEFQIGFEFRDGSITSAGSPINSNLFSAGSNPPAGNSGQNYKYAAGDRVVIISPASMVGTYALTGYGSSSISATGVPGTANNISGYILTGSVGAVRGMLTVYTDPAVLTVPVDERWTHVEIWRTPANGGIYYLERRIELDQTEFYDSLSPAGAEQKTLITETPTLRYACEMTDTMLLGQPAIGSAQFAGKLPPIGRHVCSLNGCTIIGGRAAEDAESSAVTYGRAHYFSAFDLQVFATGVYSVWDSASSLAAFAGYTFLAGDQLVITAPASHAGTYDVVTRVDDYGIRVASSASLATTTDAIAGYIRRPITYPWPQVENDEVVYHSRTDDARPESFLALGVQLSSTGDELRALVSLNRYALAVMASGVHLLYLTPAGLEKETVAESGAGCPWENAVAVIGHAAIWPSLQGVMMLETFPQANDEGRRGRLSLLDQGVMRGWIEEAHAGGYSMDCGIDTLNACLRIRRQLDDDIQVLQYSFRTQRWTLLDDDSGLVYARSRYAESVARGDEILYSVTPEGNAFEVNDYSTEHPYDDVTVQDEIRATDTFTQTRITRPGAFSADMLGDVVRFRSDTPGVDGTARVITSATADEIRFASVDGLAAGDTFIIGAVRFRLRTGPLAHSDVESSRTISGVTLRAQPGPRAGANWPDLPAGRFTVRCYRDFDADPVEERLSEVPIYNEARHVGFKDSDRVSSVGGQGSSLQLEIEQIDARSDFRIEAFRALVTESGSIADASAQE